HRRRLHRGTRIPRWKTCQFPSQSFKAVHERANAVAFFDIAASPQSVFPALFWRHAGKHLDRAGELRCVSRFNREARTRIAHSVIVGAASEDERAARGEILVDFLEAHPAFRRPILTIVDDEGMGAVQDVRHLLLGYGIIEAYIPDAFV